MTTTLVPRPNADEFVEYYGRYIARVTEADPIAALESQIEETSRVLGAVPESGAGYRYAPEKWSIRDVVGHLIDGERVFAYRALRFARADETPLPGFEENDYVHAAQSDRRTLASLAAEFRAVRAADIAMFRGFGPEVWTRRGPANNSPISVRALLYIILGHERHHLEGLRTNYGLKG